MKNIIISQSQACQIREDYLYHRGHDVDVSNPTPYRSEGRWQKWEGAGHETGSFGSGMYFTSQYPRDDRFNADDKDAIFNAKYDVRNEGEKFIQIGKNLYRVNTDFYKNLYHLKSENEGKILEEMMEAINAFVRTFNYPNKDSVKQRQRYYLNITKKSKLLGLRMPWDYRGFCEFAQQYCKDETMKQTPATIFMEKNGFNGVDASNAGKYDSYWQGSVIYDLSKAEKDIEPVLGPRNEFKLSHDFFNNNLTNDLLSNKSNPHYFVKDDDYRNDNPQEVLAILKRYTAVLPANTYWSLPDEIKRQYLIYVYNNIISGYIDIKSDYPGFYFTRARGGVNELKKDVYVKDIIKYQLYKFINIPSLTERLLDEFSWGFKVKDPNIVKGFLNAYRGNIQQDYPELYSEIADEYSF